MAKQPRTDFDPLSSSGFYAQQSGPYVELGTEDVGDTPTTPSLFEMSANLTGAVARFARSGFRLADKLQVDERLASCRTCAEYRDGRCLLCGCFVAAKVRLLTEACPLGRWQKQET